MSFIIPDYMRATVYQLITDEGYQLMDRETATRHLSTSNVGTYILRPSSLSGNFVLQYRAPYNVKVCLLQIDLSGLIFATNNKRLRITKETDNVGVMIADLLGKMDLSPKPYQLVLPPGTTVTHYKPLV